MNAAPAPSRSVGTIVRKRKSNTAATTPALLPPKPTSTDVRPTSTRPSPPGVIGREPMIRASDQPANASSTVTSPAPTSSARIIGSLPITPGALDVGAGEVTVLEEHRELAGEGRHGQDGPAPAEEAESAGAKAHEAGSIPA